ncbi:MAG TPA: sigma factor-like helix-turn-helix DNA-binding protein [Kofleriaceae bacterium]|nr:sigma factor-like helix-turn-helix DNA-binding protein [Kofleriaceae bacterium]
MSPSIAERPSQPELASSVETAFRGALVDSLEALPLGDRNMLRFHYFHGLGADRLAEMLSIHRAAVIRQLGRIRERLLRDTRRGLAARLPLDRPALARVIELARRRFDLVIARVLRSRF